MKQTENVQVNTSFHQWSALRMELIWAYDGVVLDYLQHLEVDHSLGHWLWLIRKGSVRLTHNGKTLKATEGQWILSPSGELLQEFSENSEILSLHFTCQWSTGEPLISMKDGLVFQADDFPKLKDRAQSLQRFATRSFPGSRSMMFDEDTSLDLFLKTQQRFIAFLTELVSSIEQGEPILSFNWPDDRRLARAIKCLNEAPLSEPLPLETLLKMSGLSQVHLNRLLRTRMGYTIREYWNHLRLNGACHSLENTKLTSKEISYNLGFKQPSHFATWFKKQKHMRPEAYREATHSRLLG